MGKAKPFTRDTLLTQLAAVTRYMVGTYDLETLADAYIDTYGTVPFHSVPGDIEDAFKLIAEYRL